MKLPVEARITDVQPIKVNTGRGHVKRYHPSCEIREPPRYSLTLEFCGHVPEILKCFKDTAVVGIEIDSKPFEARLDDLTKQHEDLLKDLECIKALLGSKSAT